MTVPDPGPGVITREELDWVLKRHGNRLDAAGLLAEIEASRDQAQYEPGVPYQDPDGGLWIFDRALADGSPRWLRPGLAGPFGYATPRRPLNRMVPAGAPRELPPDERDLIRADLGRLLDLLGLGDGARPQSPHEVFTACLEEVAKLKRRSGA